jgi:hypothetical protein
LVAVFESNIEEAFVLFVCVFSGAFIDWEQTRLSNVAFVSNNVDESSSRNIIACLLVNITSGRTDDARRKKCFCQQESIYYNVL